MSWREACGWLILFAVFAAGCGMCSGFHIGSHEASVSCDRGLVIR